MWLDDKKECHPLYRCWHLSRQKTKTHFGILVQMLATNRTVMQVQSETSPWSLRNVSSRVRNTRENRFKAGVIEAEVAPSRRGSEPSPKRHNILQREIRCINPCIHKSPQKRHSRVRGISTCGGWLSSTSCRGANCIFKYEY